MLLTFCPSPHQNSHSTPSPGSCTSFFSPCQLPNHSPGTIWLTLACHMGCGMGVLWPVLMFLLFPAQLSWPSLPLVISLVIVATKRTTVIINKHYTQYDLLIPHTWFYSLFPPPLPHGLPCNNSSLLGWPLALGAVATVYQGKRYTHVI